MMNIDILSLIRDMINHPCPNFNSAIIKPLLKSVGMRDYTPPFTSFWLRIQAPIPLLI